MAEVPIRAGVAREVISPPRGIYQVGYGNRSRGNRGTHDDLTATALVLDDGTRRLALVACDLLCLNEYIVDRIRVYPGITAEPIVACSHTHSGAIAYADERSSAANRAYIDTLVERIGRAIQQAEAALAPAELAWTEGEAGIAVNRRERMADGTIQTGVNPQGPADRSLQVLSVRRPGGAPVATVVNLACHGTVLGPENLLVSADWPGAMRARLEQAVGGLALFLQGAAGDLNPRVNVQTPEAGWAAVRSLGEEVANAALEACARGTTPLLGRPIGLVRQELWLPLEAAAFSDSPPPTYRRPLTRVAGLPTWLAWLVDPLLDRRYPWRSRVEAQRGLWHVPLRINAARIGDLALVTFAAETFTEIGMAIKAASPAQHTLFASVSDGCIGYLPTAGAHDQGGYEVDQAPYFYRYPGRLARDCAERAIDAAARALSQVWQA